MVQTAILHPTIRALTGAKWPVWAAVRGFRIFRCLMGSPVAKWSDWGVQAWRALSIAGQMVKQGNEPRQPARPAVS